jgi:ribosomal protein L31E
MSLVGIINIHMQKVKFRLSPYIIHKINSKGISDLTTELKLKLIEETTEIKLHDLGFDLDS